MNRSKERKHWPCGMRMPRKDYYALQLPNGRVRAIGYVSEEQAIAACADLLDRYRTGEVFAKLAAEDKRLARGKDEAYYRATARAKQYGREILSREEFEILWERCGAKCELTGITFKQRPENWSGEVWPWSPSIDRIDNAYGYEAWNCRILCVAMNLALHQFGEDVFRVLAMTYRMRDATRIPHAK